MRYLFCAAVLLALAATGCDSKTSEVPNAPVPIGKPGAGAAPGGTGKGTAPPASVQPEAQSRALPR